MHCRMPQQRSPRCSHCTGHCWRSAPLRMQCRRKALRKWPPSPQGRRRMRWHHRRMKTCPRDRRCSWCCQCFAHSIRDCKHCMRMHQRRWTCQWGTMRSLWPCCHCTSQRCTCYTSCFHCCWQTFRPRSRSSPHSHWSSTCPRGTHCRSSTLSLSSSPRCSSSSCCQRGTGRRDR